ncbi:MAG: BrnT family toxin [Devosia sp.]
MIADALYGGKGVDFEWDEAKNASNRAKHGVDFSEVSAINWSNAIIRLDLRRDYGELRMLARGFDDDDVGYHIAFTIRGNSLRVISMRRFAKGEYALYGPKA